MDVIGDADEPDPAGPGGGPTGRRAGVRPADLLQALTDGLVALAAAIVVALLGLVTVVYSAGGHVQAGPGDFFAVAVWLTGASLGVPVHQASSVTVPGVQDLTSTAEARAVAWLLTGIVLVLVFWLVRRRERGCPGADPGQLAARALLTAAVVTLALLALALATTRASVFGFPSGFAAPPSSRSGSSIGLEPGFVFAGPLLLTAAAALAGTAPWRQRAARWSPVLRVAWRQVLVTGITLLVYVAAEVGRHGNSRETAVTVTGLVLLLPNLAIYGTLGGFGTTFYGTLNTGGAGQQSGPSSVSHSIGIFGSIRPWIVWLLLGAALAGTLIPALLARHAGRAGRLHGADYPLSGAWRAAVTGILTSGAVVLLGAFSYTGSSSVAAGALFRISASAGPSLPAAVGLTAAWACLGYLATSIALGNGERRMRRRSGISASPAGAEAPGGVSRGP